MQELFWLLLPLAAASGWFAAKRSSGKPGNKRTPIFSSDYIKGLNFLLNEQPDKALAVFIEMAEVDTETVETYLVLGSLFRRRGEVDRAIRIHQNLIARPNLEPQLKANALLELGKDYMKAGLLDRAEGLFEELIALGTHGAEVYAFLRDIYEQEREWERAIGAAKNLQQASAQSQSDTIAHYHCELAEAAYRRHETGKAVQEAKTALHCDKVCVRASILLGDIAFDKGDYKLAIKNFTRVISQNPELAAIVLSKIRSAFQKGGNAKGFLRFLEKQKDQQHDTSLFLVTIDTLAEQGQIEAAQDLLTQALDAGPASFRVISEYVAIRSRTAEGECAPVLTRVAKALAAQVSESIVYLCVQCGYQAKGMLWQCPSCHGWSKMKPVDRLESGAPGEPTHSTVI